MSPSPPSPGGWLDSLRRIAMSLLGLMRNRVELFAVEWQEERLRLLNFCVGFAIAVILGLAGGLVAILTLTYWLWTVTGYLGPILLALALLGGAVALVLGLRRKIKTAPGPFAQTVAEFRKDGECLKTSK